MPQSTKRNILWSGAAFLLYSLIFVLYTWPLAKSPASVYIGKPRSGDASQYIWNTWHFSYRISQGQQPFKTDLLAYPEGSSLIMHAYTPVSGLLNMLVNDPVLSVNIILFLSFVLGGIGMFYLARHFGANLFLSLTSGFIWSFFPYKTSHLAEHFNLELTACLPFYLLFFFRAFSFSSKRLLPSAVATKPLIWLIITGVLCLLCDYYYTIYLFYFSILYLILRRTIPWFISLKSHIKILSLALLFLAGHILIRLLVVSGSDDKGALWWSGDIAALFLPPLNSLIYGDADTVKILTKAIFRYPESIEFVLFPGFAFFILLYLSLRGRKYAVHKPEIQTLTVLSVIFMLCCFPEVKVAGKTLFYNVTGLIYFIPFVNNVRTPPRYELMTMLLLLPAIGYMLTALWPQKAWRYITIACCFILLAEYYPNTYNMIGTGDVPQVYHKLQKMPDGAILPVPCGIRDGFKETGHFNTNDFLYQTVHHKPIVGGYLSRLNENIITSFSNSGTIQDILSLQSDSVSDTLHSRHTFDLPVRYIVVEPAFTNKVEAYFDSVLQHKKHIKSLSSGYLLYSLD